MPTAPACWSGLPASAMCTGISLTKTKKCRSRDGCGTAASISKRSCGDSRPKNGTDFMKWCICCSSAICRRRNSSSHFNEMLDACRDLPEGFTENMILKAPSPDIMNKLARAVLASYSYDTNPDDIGIKNVLRQCIELIARFPTMAAYGYQAKRHYYDNKSLYLHKPQAGLSTAENFLYHDPARFVLHAARSRNPRPVARAPCRTRRRKQFRVRPSRGHVVGHRHLFGHRGGRSARSKAPSTAAPISRSRRCLTTSRANVKDWKDDDEVSRLSVENPPQRGVRPEGLDLRDRACRVHAVRPARRHPAREGRGACRRKIED